jgi:hypothetical protein
VKYTFFTYLFSILYYTFERKNMKKTLLILATVASSSAFAQITINAGNLVDAMSVVELAIDLNQISHTPSGPNQTWDYSGLVESESNSLQFGAPSWFTAGSNFPNASLGSVDQSGTEVFYSKTDTAFDLLGAYGDFTGDGNLTSVSFSPYQRQLNFPSTYGSTFENESAINLTINDVQGVDSVVVTITTYKTSEIDAWGNITTPFGTFNTLRQHVKDSVVQSFTAYLFGLPVQNQSETELTHTYSFYTDAENSKYILLQYTFDPEFSTVADVQWQKSAPVASIEVAQKTNSFIAFPNPALDVVTVLSDASMNGELTVVDLVGKVIYTENLTNTQQKTIDVSSWKAGMYVFNISSNGKTSSKKVTVK